MAKRIENEFAEMKAHFEEDKNGWIFTEVIESSNTTKEELFTHLLSILAEVYKDSKEVVQVADKEAGLIVAKGFS